MPSQICFWEALVNSFQFMYFSIPESPFPFFYCLAIENHYFLLFSLCMIAQSCLTLCDPVDCSPPGPFVHRVFLARTLEWVAISFSRTSSWPRDQTHISLSLALAGRFLPTESPGKPSFVVMCSYNSLNMVYFGSLTVFIIAILNAIY